MRHLACIVATGARTPLGLYSAAAAAALRAGITRLAEHPFMIDQAGDPMPAAMDGRLDPALFGYKRFVELAASALEEAMAPLPEDTVRKVPVYLALPEVRPGFTKQDALDISDALPYSNIDPIVEGHAAGMAAFQLAVERIERGEIETCVVAGAESYFHPDTMEWLDANRQLVGSVSRSGFVPAEGAGACLLMSETAAYRRGLRPLARVAAAVIARETKLIKTDAVCLGEALTSVVRSATAYLQIPAQAVTDIYCDMNSERYRGEEWGFTCLRLPLQMANPTGYISPADCWGDMGAASAPLFAMLACQASARKYATAQERSSGPVPKVVSEAPCCWSLTMSFSVGVNPPKTPVTAGSSGIAKATTPNVCKMPGAPFTPTALPNIGKSGNSPDGYSTTVKIVGEYVAIRGATFTSNGDIASKGTGGGLISANVEGITKFITMGSPNVKIEGKSVHQLGEPMLNNCAAGGTPPNTGATLMGLKQDDDGEGEAAFEKQAIRVAKQIEKDLGKEARREFHDMKESGEGDRTMQQLKEDARAVYESYGKAPPGWLT